MGKPLLDLDDRRLAASRSCSVNSSPAQRRGVVRVPQWARQWSVERWIQMASSAPVVHGGATPAPRRETCLGWLTAAALPAWSQRAILDDNGTPVLQRYNECGETLVASIVAAVWGVGVSPDAYRGAVKGDAGSALTSAPDLVAVPAYGN